MRVRDIKPAASLRRCRGGRGEAPFGRGVGGGGVGVRFDDAMEQTRHRPDQKSANERCELLSQTIGEITGAEPARRLACIHLFFFFRFLFFFFHP